MRIVVGCNLVHAGSHPLNMNIAPSFFIDWRITAMVELEPGPEAFMIRLWSKVSHED
jgi:hypothetical protein